MSINLLNKEYFRFLKQVDIETLDNSQKFAFSYFQSIGINSNEFIQARNEQLKIAEKITSGKATLEETKEQFYLEAKSYNYLENIYLQIHRIEYMFRKGLLTFNFNNSMTELEYENWLNDFHFMTMIRNKLFEHAPENFDFFSDNGNAFLTNDIYDFRVWFFQGMGAFQDTTLPIVENFNICLDKINETLKVDYTKPFHEKCKYVRRGAQLLSKQEQYDLFNNSIKKTGFVTHTPLELLSKAFNAAKLIFINPQPIELNRRNLKVREEENLVDAIWIY